MPFRYLTIFALSWALSAEAGKKPTDRPQQSSDRLCHLEIAAYSDASPFGYWLANAIIEAEVLAATVRDRVGISHASITRYLTGERRPPRNVVVALAKALNSPPGEALFAAFEQRYKDKPRPALEHFAFLPGEKLVRLRTLALPSEVWSLFEELQPKWKTKTIDGAIATALVGLYKDLSEGIKKGSLHLFLSPDVHLSHRSVDTVDRVLRQAPFDAATEDKLDRAISLPESVKSALYWMESWLQTDITFVVTLAGIRSRYLLQNEPYAFESRFRRFFPVNREEVRYSARKCSDKELEIIRALQKKLNAEHEIQVFEFALASLYWDYHLMLQRQTYHIEAVHDILEPLLPDRRHAIHLEHYEEAWRSRNSARTHSIRVKLHPGIEEARKEMARAFGTVQTAEAIALERAYLRHVQGKAIAP